jgi:hypothetical protein
MNVKEIIEELRKIIDGEDSSVQKIEDLMNGKNAKTQSESEDFFQRIMKEVDTILRKEIVRLPTGNAYIPNGFIVFLAPADYKKFSKQKRIFAESEMGKLLIQRAKELVGSLKVSTEFIKVEIKEDGTLENGAILVIAISSEISQTIQFAFNTNKEVEPKEKSITKNLRTIEDFSTIIDDDFRPLYWLEIWQSGKKIENYPILLSEITIGRDYEESKAHIRLETENQKISGLHTSIQINENKDVKITALHKNYTQVGNQRLSMREGFQTEKMLRKNEVFQVYEFGFRLRFNP